MKNLFTLLFMVFALSINAQIIHYNGHYQVECPPVESCFPFSADADCTWGWLLRYESTMTQPDGSVVEMLTGGSTTHEFGGMPIQSSAANTPVCYNFTQTGMHTICITVHNYCWSWGDFDPDSETRCIDVLVKGDSVHSMRTQYCKGDRFEWCPNDNGVQDLELRFNWDYLSCTHSVVPDENGCIAFDVCEDLPATAIATASYQSDCSNGKYKRTNVVFSFNGESCHGGEGGAVTEFDSIR